jgi:two-component system response regulator YesN
MNFVNYKTYLRIENAKKLLKAGNLNIEKISSSLGYTDSKYFSKLFKKMTGKTPQDYKKECL